jgi:hypothetical protein
MGNSIPCENGTKNAALRSEKQSTIVTAGTRTITEARLEANDQDPARYHFAIIPI